MDAKERARLREMHAAATPGDWYYDDGVTDGEGTPDAERGKAAWITAKGNVLIAEPSGCDPKEPCVPSLAEMDANGKCIVASHNALIPLLDALDAAEAERDAALENYKRCADASREVMRTRTELHDERDAYELKAWDALGRPDGYFDTTNVQRLCEAHGSLKAKLAALVEASHKAVMIAKDKSRGWPCGQAEPSLTISHEVRIRMRAILALLNPALAAAKVQP